MIRVAVSMLDSLRPYYGMPSLYVTLDEAVRDFRYTCENVPQVKAFPENFSLVYLFDFDDESGKIIEVDHQVLARAVDFVREPELLDTLKVAIKELVLEHKEVLERSGK